jgi:hypothetical protein
MTNYYWEPGMTPRKSESWSLELVRLWEKEDARVVARDTVRGYLVSTVFLSIDHSYGGGPPILFETMVFGGNGEGDVFCDRYATEEEARAGHTKTVDIVTRAAEEWCP